VGADRVVVTGATGNVGSALLRQLDGDVVGIARHAPDRVPPFDRAEWVEVDLGAPDATEALAEACAGASALVHLAWAIQPDEHPDEAERTAQAGMRTVLDAVVAAGVPHLVFTSSTSVYAPARVPVGEDQPRTGIAGSTYSAQKNAAEDELDRFADEHPDVLVTRLRPGLIVQRAAARQFTRLFLGRLAPRPLLRLARRGLLPFVPVPAGLQVQLVHSDDVAAAVVLALRHRPSGAVDVATDALDARGIAAVVGARPLSVPPGLVRGLVRLLDAVGPGHLTPGWFALLTGTPVVTCRRARDELGWTPRRTGAEVARELLDGLVDDATGTGPVLAG
jgi:UDP-glucose 4-epimerase